MTSVIGFFNDTFFKEEISVVFEVLEYDIKFYQNNMKLFATVDQQQSQQIQQMRQQFQFSVHEFEQLKEQYQHRERDLQVLSKYSIEKTNSNLCHLALSKSI